MLPFQVPAQTQPAPVAPVPLATALARVLDEYDLKGEGSPLTAPLVQPADAPALRWLLEALTKDLPDNPFPGHSAAHREAEALRALLKSAAANPDSRIAAQSLGETGTQMGLWRWGRRMVRAGRLGKGPRQLWEDCLLAVPIPTLATGYALRHALSFALAENDLGRFADLKAAHGGDAPDTLLGFQRLFGLVGTQGPKLHLWRLPGLQASQRYVQELGGERVWVSPKDPGPLPAGVAWIVPSTSGALEEAAPALDDDSRTEAEGLSKALAGSGRGAWFAPSRADFEAHGLTLFPVLIQTDFRGFILSIRLGEAAPERP